MKALHIAGALSLALAAAASVHAVPRSDNILIASQNVKRPPVTQRTATGSTAPTPDIRVVSGTAADQTGYIHYFIITGPDGEPESHVGIELPNDRIAWSFPGMGVTIVPFMKRGTVFADGQQYEIEYLYGLRPLRDAEALRVLQRNVVERVAWWVDEKIPYCDEAQPYNRLCVSCLGFVLRVLFPGPSPALPALPPDFRSARRNVYTTEDLLLYLAGVRIDLAREARSRRIAALQIPEGLREQLVRLALGDGSPEAAAAQSGDPRPAVARPRATGRSMVNTPRRNASKRGS